MGLLGYGSITLTDLTEALPISLNLSSSLATNIQVQEGDVFTPDFTDKGVIITPSVFLGGKEVEASKYVGKIKYSINGTSVQPNEKDASGNLVCYKIADNLTENISIGANITDFTSDEGITYTAVYALNPITLMLLKKDGGFSAFIESTRDFFEEGNATPITLTACLYSGTEEQTEKVSYQWLDSKGNKIGNEKTLTINRDEVGSIETYICEITNQYGTKFRVSKNIYDRTDAYYGSIISNGSTILTPQNTKITLTNQIWYKTDIINGEGSTGFAYNWYCLGGNGNNFSDEDHGKERTFEIDLAHTHDDGELVFPKDNFVVYCETTIHGKAVAISSLSIQYSPTSYQVSIEPIAFFVPSSSTGAYKGSSKFSKTLRFQLLDDNKQPLTFNETSDENPTIGSFSPFTACDITQNTEGKWDFNITLEYEEEKDTEKSFLAMDASKTFTINYKYLGVAFDTSFECIKSVQGENGEIGASGYTVSLSNEFWMLAGGESKANEGQITETKIEVYEGATILTVTGLKIESNGNSYSFGSGTEITAGKITITKSADNKTLTFETGEGITSGGVFQIYVSFTNLREETITMVKTFKYEINYKGDSYELLCSPTSLIYTPATKTFNSEQITLSPVCYVGGKGEPTAVSLSDCKITAQVDGGTEQKLSSLSYTAFTKNNTSITFRLYKGTSDNAEVVDILTVPIIVSQEGLIIGGENLIPWTKKMPFGNNKWEEVGSVLREESYGFTTLDFTGEQTTTNNHCLTPKFPAQEDFFGKQMTFSAEVYCADWGVLTGSQNFYFILRIAEDTTKSYVMGSIRATTFTNGMTSDDVTAPVNGKWFKVYSTFTYPSAFESISNGNLYVSFGTDPCAPIKVKKLKLEQSNIPSAWSARNGDTTLEDVAGTNLCQNLNLHTQIHGNDPYICLNSSLEKDTQYTFSIMETSIEGAVSGQTQFLWQIVKINTSSSGDGSQIITDGALNYQFSNSSLTTQEKTFTTPSDDSTYGLIVYARGDSETGAESTILTISYVKIEKGTEATPFVATEDYLSNLYNELVKNTNEKVQEIGIKLADGGEIITQLNGIEQDIKDLNNTLTGSYITKNDAENQIKMVSDRLTPIADKEGYLQQLQSSITFSTESTPYIQIETKGGSNSFATKITDSQIGFYQNGSTEPIAYLSSNTLQVNYAHFNKSFNIGDLIVSITDSGVGFNW